MIGDEKDVEEIEEIEEEDCECLAKE